MSEFATHVYVCRTESAALRGLERLDADFDNLRRPFPALDEILWKYGPEATAARMELAAVTCAAEGRTPSGGTNPGDQRAIFALVRHFKPRSVLEIGTHLGYSTSNIAFALEQNRKETGLPAHLVSVDVRDVNDAPDAPWRIAGAPCAPRDAVAAMAEGIDVAFVEANSLSFLAQTEARFDFVFLDGDHAAPHVYRELQMLDRVLLPNAVVLLHDYFPNGKALWPGSLPCTGPWRAIRRLRREGAPVEVQPFGSLPWPTKLGSRLSSLALLTQAG